MVIIAARRDQCEIRGINHGTVMLGDANETEEAKPLVPVNWKQLKFGPSRDEPFYWLAAPKELFRECASAYLSDGNFSNHPKSRRYFSSKSRF
jgi:hypothetical protein